MTCETIELPLPLSFKMPSFNAWQHGLEHRMAYSAGNWEDRLVDGLFNGIGLSSPSSCQERVGKNLNFGKVQEGVSPPSSSLRM